MINNIPVRVRNISNNELPMYETKGAACADLRAHLTGRIAIMPGETSVVPTGLFMEIPTGYEVQVRPRSGLSAKCSITVTNSPGTIDDDYRGELKVILTNLGEQPFIINSGDRVAQIAIKPVYQIQWIESDSLTKTERGENGLGSTGVK